ncbi:CRISPR-associated endonuclease Cas3'' [Sinosporangium siamense]|uniref:CRISPR-associated endonuclease Cas3'' n=1 Tax=Sinosporangium siamense TaxID=1367973 RepID=UPI00194DE446|nr:CRISPR-associated endonuclease Cas3'' [Sinosporangium siamense]
MANALHAHNKQMWQKLQGPQPYTPYLSPAHLDAWARTSPAPSPNDVPPAPFLHGLQRESAQVSVAWRDLDGDRQQWQQSVELLPPTVEESIELPLTAVRQWLSGLDRTSDFTDVEGEPDPEDAEEPGPLARPVIRYGSRDEIEIVPGARIRAGDRLVVPTGYGGCDEYGWNPAETQPALDVGDLCGGNGRRAVSVRMGPTLVAAFNQHGPDLAEAVAQAVERVDEWRRADQVDAEACSALIKQILAEPRAAMPPGPGYEESGDDLPPHLAVLRRLALARKPTAVEHVGLGCVVLTSDTTSFGEDATARGSSSGAEPVRLEDHQRAVARRAVEFAGYLHLPHDLQRALELAALWHDEGKRDERFQVMLHRGDRWLAAARPHDLAKSGMDPLDRSLFRQAQRRSGYPAGMRHEALSAQIAPVLLEREPIVDGDLVVHLIAGHHGFGRPLLPPVTDPSPVTAVHQGGHKIEIDSSASVDWSSPARFAVLTKKHGRWGLARLETVLRLADIWCSARQEADREDS